jgi:A/G-specific adenine glycosylase
MSQSSQIAEDHLSRVRRAVIRWYNHSGRSYPWRGTGSPFSVLVAEMMLRRTTAAAVSKVYTHFLSVYPSPALLSDASLGSISRIVAPLGLQRTRSKHLKEMGRILIEAHSGEVPSDEKSLLALPGVGDYVASAVRNFAFNQRVPLVDNNIIHLVSRLFGTEFGGPEDRAAWDFMQRFGGRAQDPRFYWGLIDLVAVVCRRRAPLCDCCPLTNECLWHSHHRADSV